MKRIYGYIVVMSCMLFVSCEQVLFEEDEADDPEAVFEYMWRQCRDKYAFFEYKNIDWDEVHRQYRPLVHPGISDDSLFNVMGAMLNELRDAHVNLVSRFNVSHYPIRLTGPENVNFRNIQENYLRSDFMSTGPFAHNFIHDGRIGYILYPSFANIVDDDQLDYIFKRYANTKGLIIDLRSNGGGNPQNIYRIVNRFTSERTFLFNSYLKNGPGPDDFTKPQAAYAVPSNKPGFRGNVVVLTNRGTYSAASFFVLSARALSNVTIMGDTTGGGLGLPNGGQLPNGWTYRFSTSKTLDPDRNNFENGIPPDVRSILTKADEDQGIDTVIEDAAVLLLK
jgi:hypothetical protein